MADTQDATFEGWAVVELMGHRTRAGRVRPVELFGAKLLRIDIPSGDADADGYVTEFYSGTALYGLRPCDEATARRTAGWMRPRPVKQLAFEAEPSEFVVCRACSSDHFCPEHDAEDADYHPDN